MEGMMGVMELKNGIPGPTSANDYDGSGKGKSKVDEGRSSRDSFAINGMASEKMNIDERVINKKKNGKNGGVKNVNASCQSNKDNAMKGVGSQNMFSALSDEVEIEKRLEWESMKERIDDACEKSLRISIEEKSNWSKDLWNYFKVKMQELIRKENVADLKLKIKNLENHISHSSRMIAKESKTKLESMVKSVMVEKGLTENQATRKVHEYVYSNEQDRIKEMIMKKQFAEVELFFKTGQVLSIAKMESWSEEKVGFYKNSIGVEAYDNMVSQIGMGNSKDMNDEVAEDRSGIAQFLTQDVVFNVGNYELNQEQDTSVPLPIV
ncbi:hypothetical protein Tco_0820735 [Tanacetum coccineum]|uniref:Uncharacterized protein n=1 Tax=Tanacetum coccineum TaxID=301880 RepID=A0ABQ5AEH2_9ASTR